MRLKLTLDELGNVFLLLLYGNMGYIPVLMPNTGGAVTVQNQINESHGLTHIVLFVTWAIILVLLYKSRFKLQLNLLSAKTALGYCAIIMLPILWTHDLTNSVSSFVQITISTIYAIYLISRFPLERLAVMLSWVFVILTVGSFSFGLLLPQYGRDHFGNSGSWQGITAQKNTLGLVMAYGVAIALAMKPATFVHRCVRAGLLILCLGMVYLSQSREAWLVSAMLFMVHFFLKLVSRFARRSRRPVLLICFIGILLVAGVIATNWVEFLKLLGRDATLRGRTELWAAVLLECQNHLWRGHSGSPFWGTGAANRIYAVTGWLPTSAHNGFLECLLDYGIPALFFLGLLFLISIRNGIRLLYTSESYESRKLWIYLIFTISIFNMVQTTTGFPNSISWLFLVGSACVLERSVKAAVQPVARTRWAPTPMLTLTNPAS